MDVGGRLGEYRFHLLFGLAGVVALYRIEADNFLLFHSLVELFSVLVAFGVFIVAWNSRDKLENPYLALLGVSFLYIGGVDVLHTLAYKGMGVFPSAGADLPTQLWLLARYLEGFSLVAAGVVGLRSTSGESDGPDRVGRSVPSLAGGFAVVTGLGLGSIFLVDVFPRAYVAGSGLTRFKVVSEYVIVGLLLFSLVLLYAQRESMEERVFGLLAVAIVLSAVSELAFTLYVDVYGFSNTVGHVLKFGSFYLIYLAVVKTGITDPQDTLYRELAQREAEARKFEQAVEHSGHAVVITDRDGTIQYVNPMYEDITGYPEDELVGENPRLVKSSEHDDAFYEEMWETICAGEVWEGEIVNERRDGEQFVANQTIAPTTDAEGDIQHFVGVHMDISDRKKQERELLQRYESLFNSIRDAIFVADSDRRIVNANPAFSDLFGYELDDVEGASTKFLYEDDAAFERVDDAIRDGADGTRFTHTVDYVKQSGRIFPGETTVSYLRDADENVVGYIGLIRDLSDRENRLHQLQILDRILRHNLRNDMNIVEGYADVIRHEGSGRVVENARDIIAASERLLDLANKEREVTNILLESHPPVRVDLSSTVESVVTDVRRRYPGADVSLSVPDECPVRTHPSISRAVEELVENAVVHSDRTVPSVGVFVEGGPDRATVRVDDDGPGIPEMEQAVLDRERTVDQLYHGSGLGLWLVTLIVQQSDGVLEFRDNDPRGSSVCVRLPVDRDRTASESLPTD